MDAELIIIGGGVVGLAVAARLSRKRDVILLERHQSFGQGSSSRNSEVLHAGIYYEPGSLKAHCCVEGRREIESLAAEGRCGYQRIGKLIVARDEAEEATLQALLAKGRANGVEELSLVASDFLEREEPELRARAALFSPATGIVDSHGLMKHFASEAERNGATLAFGSEVIGLAPTDKGWRLEVLEHAREPGPVRLGSVKRLPAPAPLHQPPLVLEARLVINCAGLHADQVAALAGIPVDEQGLRQYWSRGEYFAPKGPGPRLRHLVYPVPDAGGGGHLGIHATLDLGGQLRFGPSAAWPEPLELRDEDYRQDDSLAAAFVESVRRFLPGVNGPFRPAGVGLRARAFAPGAKGRDFCVREESGQGLPGLVTLIGIESPGLTSAPALARVVERLVNKT